MKARFHCLAFNQMKIGLGLRLISSIRTRFSMRFSFDRQEKKLLNNAVHHGGFVGMNNHDAELTLN